VAVFALKEKIPESLKERVRFVFGSAMALYNLKWMYDYTFPEDTNTSKNEKIKGTLLSKLDDDTELTMEEMTKFRHCIISGGPEINIIYSHCVEHKWFGQSSCIRRDLEAQCPP